MLFVVVEHFRAGKVQDVHRRHQNGVEPDVIPEMYSPRSTAIANPVGIVFLRFAAQLSIGSRLS